MAHIATALQTNNTLKSVTHISYDNATDKAALSLAATLSTNTSIEDMGIGWSLTHPDSTLKEMVDCIKNSTLKSLDLNVQRPWLRPSGDARMSVEEAIEWYQHLEIGGKEFILSLEDSHLESFSLNPLGFGRFKDLNTQACRSLKAAALSVNSARIKKKLPYIHFTIVQLTD